MIEGLNVAGMLKNHHLAQATGDVGFGAFRRQLSYKAAWYGGRVLDCDLNASINLAKFATLAGNTSERQNACGEESAGQGHVALVQLSPLKQEPNTFDASA